MNNLHVNIKIHVHVYREKSILLFGVQHSVIMANFITPETHQPIIVIILFIYSVYLLKNLLELQEYTCVFQVEQLAISSSFHVSYKHSSWSVELERAFIYVPRPLIDRAPENDVTSLTMYTTHTRVSETNIYTCIYIYIKPRGKQSQGQPYGPQKFSEEIVLIFLWEYYIHVDCCIFSCYAKFYQLLIVNKFLSLQIKLYIITFPYIPYFLHSMVCFK